MAGTAYKKKTAAVKGKAGKSKKQDARKTQEEDFSFIRTEVIIIASFTAAVLLLLSNFHLCGVAGDFLRSVQLGLFGLIGYIAPILIFAGIFFYLSNRGNRRAMVKLFACSIGLLTLCGFAQLLFGDIYKPGDKLTGFYTVSSMAGKGGGLAGGLLTAALSSLIGRLGAYFVLFVILIICVVCITERSFVNAVKAGSGKAYHHAREDMSRRREIHAERQEERRRLREEQKIRGVNLDATRLTYASDPDLQEALDGLDEMPDVLSSGQADEALEAELTYAKELTEVTYDYGEEAVFPENQADLFKGDILYPSEYLEEDTVPLDLDGDLTPPFIQEEVIFADKKDMAFDDKPDIVGEQGGVNHDSFIVPEESKKVVTASGKVIETETEALQKKLESGRKEAKAESEAAPQIPLNEGKEPVKKEYVYPPASLLTKGTRAGSFSDREYKETAIKLQKTLQNFGVGVTVTNISCGPSVTRYELHPEQGVKVSRIVGLADDIKLSLAAADIRIEAPIPGKSAVGIEVPNKETNMVFLRDILDSDEFRKHPSKVAFAVGKDIGGQVVVTDIAKMPHLLIAGSTGSGKSVCINTLIMSIIFKADPNDVKLIMVDPKVVELSVYNGIPHLLIPVVTDPKKASGALNWAVAEMTDRYKKFADHNVRDLKGYNAKIEQIKAASDQEKPVRLPQIIIIIDELADLMMVAPGEVEDSICRLAQLARAAGIHLVIATQRPSVNVITGLIKANVPSRIAFAVSSGVDSRTIIDMNGAEKLLGKGDMLFYPSGYPKPMRVQGAFVSDQEVSKVVEFLTEQGMSADYSKEVERVVASPAAVDAKDPVDSRDEYFLQAAKFIIEKEKASIGMLQRVFKIGFNRAARIMDQLAEAGVVGEEEGTKPRKVLMSMEEFNEMNDNSL